MDLIFDNGSDDLIMEKLIILFTFNKLDEDVTDSQLTQIILDTEVMNYFTLQVLLPKMIESKFIKTYNKGETTLYTMTQSGLEVLEFFENRIPEYFKKKLRDYIFENEDEIFSLKIKKQASYAVQPDNTFKVTLIIIRGRANVMSININAESEIEAQTLCEKWNSGYLEKYEKIIEALYS